MNQKELIESLNAYWRENKIFEKSLDQRSEKFQSVTYDGPPFASGTPHFGHGLTSSMKDAILRFKTMKGYKVNRDRGRDCHGLPVEKAVEKELGLDGKKDIEKLGVQKFVEECRKYVSNTSDERKNFVDQIGRRADMDHAYYTMNLDYMESIIRVIQNMYNQNLVYKGFNVQWMCPSCATTLSNSEVNEGYKDRQDPAITIKFKIALAKNEKHETTSDGFIHTTKAIIKDEQGRYLTLFDTRWDFWTLPGGKVDTGETLEASLTRELNEELGVKIVKSELIGSRKYIGKQNVLAHYFEVTISGTPKIQESNKHNELKYVEILSNDNDLGFAIKIDSVIIDDVNELMSRFLSFYTINNVLPYTKEHKNEMKDGDVNFLAWTTTPRTLPSNMFLAVGKHIRYVLLFDKASKEYYILAENLIKQFYKENNEYILINIFKGEDLVGLKYEPLFQHINKSKIDKKYKEQFFKIIAGEFVSTEDGTGIVHIAPAFGMDDYNAVAQFLPRDESKNWLFLPVNEYGEFTDEVPERKGTRVYDANKDIIQRLKEEKKLIGQKSYEHSYPHCRRCDTPLISKALTSWFIKEQELTNITVPHAESIGFVPETVKKRFIDVLKSAPDWNLARNRYRGAPLPIWEAVTSYKLKVTDKEQPVPGNLRPVTKDDIIVCGTLEEIYQGTRDGSQNITKNILIRHGRTDLNEISHHDSLGDGVLSKLGEKQAKSIKTQIKKATKKDKKINIYMSPLKRVLMTLLPYLESSYSKEEIVTLINKHEDITKIFRNLRNKNELITYIKNSNSKKTFELIPNVYIDFRLTEYIVPEAQDKSYSSSLVESIACDKQMYPHSESIDDMKARIQEIVTEVNTKHKAETILLASHGEPVTMIKNIFKTFDYLKKRKEFYPRNNTLEEHKVQIHYRDNDRNTEIDLHKPYVDSYRFKKGNKEYRRIPEVMDCWFESGSMPFGQAGYTADHSTKKLIYPADFIIEGLDQTRGWFRGMHVCGNAVMKKNSFNNVVINGLVLAEDGKKMSKKLKNYPDPEYLFGKYGTDAYRLYLLASPGVRAEPVRFSEKGVEQVYKDFTGSIMNTYKFFETYANVDKWSTDNTTAYFMKDAESQDIKNLQNDKFIEQVLRIHPDIIYTKSNETAKEVVNIMKLYRDKKIKIKSIETYTTILKKNKGKNILIISDDTYFKELRTDLYDTKASLEQLEVIKLPTYRINNELDKRILAELHNLGIQLEQEMNKYFLDTSAKLVLGFIEKLNNRFIRRSRRRFRASGMDEDKNSAFNTLFEVVQSYMKLCASFAPFVSEHIYLELQKFTKQGKVEGDSVHLQHFPIYSEQYIDKQLLEEISVVRKIISLGLFIRSKNKIAVKQPLAKMQIRI
ncbi:MAG: class I tRNA ligase family protein [candidate division SR1 bacterium]|nr:class I tRNA ligase family protein [candidate division SR1 bacterium]